MWQTRMDMSRDECRKCLRCLELDAYGNMVSVLRAQGSFTEDKKRLLEELAKVLHISNERHRAEVRRAANDEKLSIIAEQLNGPNTWTDWAIEGRRTIPLLPRLKAHTAFTGLANSLSLVIATANEKKVPFEEKRAEPIVKAETTSQNDLVASEKPPQKPQLSQPKTRGRKRKKSLPENFQDLKNPKLSTSDMNNHGAIINSIINELSREVRTSPSPLPLNSVEAVKSNERSISNSPEAPQRPGDAPETPQNCTVPPKDKLHNNESTDTIICQLEINRTPDTAIAKTPYNVNYESEINSERLSTEVNSHEHKDVIMRIEEEMVDIKEEVNRIGKNEVNRVDEGESKVEEEMRDEDLLRTSNASSVQRIQSTNCERKYSDVSSSLEGLEDVSEDNSRSSGPGPAEEEGETVDGSHPRVEVLKDPSGMKKRLKLNSNSTINISSLKNSRLGLKTNIIMVQKGVKLSHAGKDMLNKVIADDSLRISNKPPVIPHHSLPNNNEQAINSDVKQSVDAVVLDIRQDDLDLENHNEDCFEPADETNSKTNSIDSVGEQSQDCGDEAAVKTEDFMQNVKHGLGVVITEDNEQSNDISGHENCVEKAEETIEISGEAVGEGILIEQENETVLIDAQTEIYNFESTDDTVCEIQIDETVPTSTLDLFTTPLTSKAIALENYTYEEETETLEDNPPPVQTSNVEQLNHHDS
ncbi:uncharacterized protein LOC107044929 [Diachasma alloeum]|uniref:uncharacterized protein LOC107044929 n=1 Tax=Diachasma alloeum TaxID=454923 RepID=UPI0007383782|nr:uncharacterized protein LOC107044929 [Diachasma alloeum]